MFEDLTPGTVTLVGGGPGHPDLITVAGLKAIQQADVILYDRLAPQELLKEAPDAELIPVGKVPRGEYVPQEHTNQMLIAHARKNRRVVRLKGGDNFVFGRGGEEWQACAAAGVPVRVIPGVTSVVAGPALVGIPLTHRSLVQGFTVVSGHVPSDDPRSRIDWQGLAHTQTTLVILMGVANIGSIAADLQEGGMAPSTPVVVVSNASLDDQSSIHSALGEVAQVMETANVRPPSLVIVGEVAGLDLDHTDPALRKPSNH